MPSDCCYFVVKAAAADAAPALNYFSSILHRSAVFTQNLGQTLRCQLEESSAQTSANPLLTDEHISSITSQFARLPSEYLLNSTIRLFHQIGQIFRENAAPPSNPMGIRIDSKRRKKLMQKRLAMGHKQDDHEQNYGQTLQ